MSRYIVATIPNVEVVAKGSRKDKEGRDRPFLKGLVHRSNGDVDLLWISGEMGPADPDPVGKTYDMELGLRASTDEIYCRLLSARFKASKKVA